MFTKRTMEAFTTDSSGIKYGLGKDHGKSSLQMAKCRIEHLHMQDHPYAVHVFRNVIEPRDEVLQWVAGDAAAFVEDVLELSLQSVEEYRLYEKCKIAVGKPHKLTKGKRGDALVRQILQRFNDVGDINLDEVADSVGDERRSIISRIERFFTHATRDNAKYWYIYNCENPPKGIEGCLTGISGHLDPTKNSRIAEMPGINTSIIYVGSAGSFTEMHVEDSIADSVNVIHAGEQKIWMIIDRDDYARTNDIINQKLKEVLRVKNDQKNGETTEVCVLPLHHKNLVLTPRLLDEHKIRYEFVVQNAGDLLYVRYGILHQVINLGTNIAEAINVGSDGWNFSNDLKMLCRCETCQLIHAATNTDVNMTVKVSKVKGPTHRCDSCARIFGTKKLLMKHQKEDHGFSPKNVCEICDKQFQHVQSLKRPVRAAHPTSEENRTRPGVCDVCNKLVEDMLRHKRDRHLKLVECSECRAKFTRYELAEHEKKCIEFTCAECSSQFKSRHSLAIHRRWCKQNKRPRSDQKRKVDK